MTAVVRFLEGALEGGSGDQAKYLGCLGEVPRHYQWGGSPFVGDDRSSLVPRSALPPSSFGYIGVTIVPSGLEKGVTLTLFAIGSSPTHHPNLSGSGTHLVI